MRAIQSVQVFCGANKGTDPLYEQTAVELGQTLARQGIRLVYGGGNVGLMGSIADAVLAHGGQVTGVIPDFLRQREVCHEQLSELIVVPSMAERKRIMAERSDGVITLPGGYGTLDELFEMLTMGQLGHKIQPIGLLNIKGFFDPLVAQLDRMQAEQFLKPAHHALLLVSEHIDDLLTQMEHYAPQMATSKWFL